MNPATGFRAARRCAMPWLAAVACAAATTTAAESGAGPRVTIRDGIFVEAATGRPFRPLGFNYIRLAGSHSTFDPGRYDGPAAEVLFRRLHGDGFNTVRVFVNTAAQPAGSVAIPGQAGLSPDYLACVTDFLSRARRNEIGVMLSMESFPPVPPYRDELEPLPAVIHGLNATHLAAGHLRAKARFLRDFIAGLRARDPAASGAVFAYDLCNELCHHGVAPFTLTTGSVTGASGRVYRLPDDRQALADESAMEFINRMADVIHGAQPGALVCAGVFTCRAVGRSGPGDFAVSSAAWKNRVPFRPLVIAQSKADFLDVHFYPTDAAEFARDLESIEFEAVRRLARERGKPLIVGEFGSFKRSFPRADKAAAWMGDLAGLFIRNDFQGWLHWTYDTHEQGGELWHARDADDLIYRRLKAAAFGRP